MYSIKETAVCWIKKKNLYKCLSNVHCFRAPRTSVPLWCFKSVSSRKWVFHRSLDCPLFWKKLYRSCGVSVGPMYIICIVIFWGILLIFVETKTLKPTKLSSETQLNDMIKSDGPEIKTVRKSVRFRDISPCEILNATRKTKEFSYSTSSHYSSVQLWLTVQLQKTFPVITGWIDTDFFFKFLDGSEAA